MTDSFEIKPDNNAEPARGSESIASLETQLAQQKESIKRLKEEKYCLVLLVIILFDSVVFQHFNNWGDSVAIIILEIIFLIVVARHCEVDDVTDVNKFIDTEATKD